MFGAIRRLFGNSDTPAPASSTQSAELLLRQLGQLQIYIIAEMQSEGIDPAGLTKEQLLEEIGRAAKDLNERQSFRPFIYEAADGQRRLPFFTDMQHAEVFVGEYSKQKNRVFPFQMLGIKGSLLGQMIPACDVLVMDDQSPDEIEFAGDDLEVARNAWQ